MRWNWNGALAGVLWGAFAILIGELASQAGDVLGVQRPWLGVIGFFGAMAVGGAFWRSRP